LDQIYDALQTLWGTASEYVPEQILTCIVVICILSLLYFLFIRLLLKLTRSTSLVRMADILFMTIAILTALYYIAPTINVVKTSIEGVSP